MRNALNTQISAQRGFLVKADYVKKRKTRGFDWSFAAIHGKHSWVPQKQGAGEGREEERDCMWVEEESGSRRAFWWIEWPGLSGSYSTLPSVTQSALRLAWALVAMVNGFAVGSLGKDVFAGGWEGEGGGWGEGDLHSDLVAGLTGQSSSNTFYILHTHKPLSVCRGISYSLWKCGKVCSS